MNASNIEKSPIPINVTNNVTKMSKARILMIAALAIYFLSLFLPYQDEGTSGDQPILWNTGVIVHLQNTVPEQTGFQLFHYAGFVVGGLFLLFITAFYKNAFWQRYGYWISLVLVLFFAFGGAVIRTSGGKLSLLCVALIILAAYLNAKDRKLQKDVVSPSGDVK